MYCSTEGYCQMETEYLKPHTLLEGLEELGLGMIYAVKFLVFGVYNPSITHDERRNSD